MVHLPERLGWRQSLADEVRDRDAFYVYVLDTDSGIYVGHTADFEERMLRHLEGRVSSTRFSVIRRGYCNAISFGSREEAAEYEAYLKNLRDSLDERFYEEVGLPPLPFWRRCPCGELTGSIHCEC